MNSLPRSLRQPLEVVLARLGDRTSVQGCEVLGGGCINHASRIETGKCNYFLKWNSNPLPGLFAKEAAGLKLLADTQTVIVPQVFGFSEQTTESPAFLLLEWLEGSGEQDLAKLGEQLAELHRSSPELPPSYQFGLEHDNYLGSFPQLNHPRGDWPTFFTRQRLLPQMAVCEKLGHLPSLRRQRLEKLIERLPTILAGLDHFPSLIHGDLWGGNVIESPRGLALIDPAVSYSSREAEIAYTELFGGFPARFYSAYQSTWPLPDGYADRRDLYNLYHLLNHLNHFGESYGHQVDLVLRRYTSAA